MMEAPEAINIASQLSDTVKGKRITVAEALYTPHKFTFFNGEPAQCEERLTGRVITGVRHYGGMVHIEAEDTRLILSEGVNIRLYGPGEELPKKHQLLIGFTDESCIVVSVRMYGAIWCYPDGELAGNLTEYFEAARDKPQVLSDDFTEEYFNSLIGSARMRKKSAKAALATERSIPGLGNGVLQDILYNAGIHPKTKIQDIPAEKLAGLYRTTKDTLHKMAAGGGRSSESDIFGRSGSYIAWLSKDTAGETCTRCGSIILKENYLGGSIYYCPGCQPYPVKDRAQ